MKSESRLTFNSPNMVGCLNPWWIHLTLPAQASLFPQSSWKMQVITIHFASNCPSVNVGRWEEVCYLMPQLTASGPPTYSASPNQLAFESGIWLWKWVSRICPWWVPLSPFSWALWFLVPVYLPYIPNRLILPSILQLLIHNILNINLFTSSSRLQMLVFQN